MQIKNLNKKDINMIIDLYLKHKKEFYDYKTLTIEDFSEQFCHRCDNCGEIIYILDNCKECDEEEEENEFQEFELNKEHYVYGL